MLRVEGRIVNHDREFDGAVTIDETTGLIVSVDDVAGRSDVDTSGCLIFPGFGDIHIHAREDTSGFEIYKEDFTTAGEAALQGGVTHVADMPNNRIAPIDDARYEAKEELAAKCAVHVTLYAGIGPHTRPLERHVPYKAFMGPSVGDLFFSSREQLETAIAFYRGQNVSFHCEDPIILEQHKEASRHEDRRPAQAELTATEFALHLIEKYELQGKLCHYSVGKGLPQIEEARKRGVRVTCEVTPHHLYFDATMLTDENRNWLQMNPPLRGPEDKVALLEALRAGLIDYIATDHAPHSLEEKERGISGVPHLDTYGAFVTWLMKEQNFTPQQISRVCACNPARWVKEFLPQGCGEGYGVIAPGYMGSLTILDRNAPWTVRREDVKTKSGWSPFEGVTFPGRVRATVIAGKVHGRTY